MTIDIPTVVSVLILCFISGHIFYTLMLGISSRDLSINLSNPIRVHGFFYIQYFILPFFIALYSNSILVSNKTIISIAIAVSYIGWIAGTRLTSHKDFPGVNTTRISSRDIYAFIVLSFACIILISYRYIWKIADGSFHNHFAQSKADPGFETTLRNVIAPSLEFIPIFLFSISAKCSGNSRAIAFSKIAFHVYCASLFIIFVLSSQTRPAITCLICYQLCKGIVKPIRTNVLMLMSLLAVGIIGFLVVQGMRLQYLGFKESDNQFYYALSNWYSGGLQSSIESSSEVQDRSVARSVGIVVFLDWIIDATSRSDFLFGQGFIELLPSHIPGLLWPDKPPIYASQIVYQTLLGKQIALDATPSPVCLLYADGGLPFVFLGYTLLGILYRILIVKLTTPNNIFWIFAFSFAWTQFSNFELDVFHGLIGSIKTVAVTYVFFIIIRAFMPGK